MEVAVCASCSVRLTVRGSCGVWELLCVGVAVYGSCGVWELRCVGVAV